MERLGRIMTGDSTLEVQVRGDRAYAKPGCVVLPALERYECIGAENAERVIHGVGDHEFGHASDSDFEVIARARRRGESPAFVALLNVLEDGYVEGRRGLLYPGTRYNLTKKNDWFWATDFTPSGGLPSCMQRIGSGRGTLWERFLLALTMVVRPYGGPSFEEAAAIDDEVGRMLEEIKPHLEELPPLFSRSRQSAEVERVARAIWDAFTGPKEVSENEEPKEGGEGQEDLDFGPGGPGKGGKPVDVEGEIARFNTQPPGEPLNPEEAVQARVRAMFEQPSDVRPYVVFDQSFDIERDFSSEQLAPLSAEYEGYRKAAEGVTGELVYAFESALRDRTMRRLSFGGDEEGEIDPALLPSFSLGATHHEDLWLDYRAEEEGGHAAVAILIDCSGSMGNGTSFGRDQRGRFVEAPSRSYLARLCAIAAHEALKRCQVPHEINGFTTIASHTFRSYSWSVGRDREYREHFERLREACREAQAQGTNLRQFARTWWDGILQVPIYATFKGFGHEDGRGLVRVAGLGANLDGEAILWQARRLVRRPERRKVMVVLSDGYPSGCHDDAQGAQHLTEAVQRALGAGIEVYGIGVQSAAVMSFYPHWWVVEELHELPAVMIRALMESVVTVGSSAWVR